MGDQHTKLKVRVNNPMEYPKEYIDKACDLVTQKLRKSFELNGLTPDGIPPHKVIAFFLDTYNTGNFYGTLSCKITGLQVHDPKKLEVSERLDLLYNV